MSIGPSIIFDKSALQGLSADESMWLENFFISNITPLFFVETLADLEKATRSGRTPEDVVGDIAHKTPDMGCVGVHHRNLISGELMGQGKVVMDGRPVITGGRTLELDGKMGIFFQESPEMEAAHRWEKRQFLEIERSVAKKWREELSLMGNEDYSVFESFFGVAGRSKTLDELKKQVDFMVDGMDNKDFLDYGMSLMGIMPSARTKVIERWEQVEPSTLREFAPYFAYVLSVDLFFYMGTALKLFNMFPHPKTHKVDMAYLYYLPFCQVFTSSDKIHTTLSPIFMRPDQTFVSGADLKSDFSKLDEHYDKLSDEVKNRGSMVFAPCPPDDVSFLTTRLWDKHMGKSWRSLKDSRRKFDGTDKIDPELEGAITEKMKRFVKEGRPVDSSKLPNSDDADSIMLRHMVSARKGKWNKFPPEVLESKPLLD